METQTAASDTVLPVPTQLAFDRTSLAHERTLMAWIRTATSLISFGFTIYKFFQYMVEKGQRDQSERLLGPREYGLIMIGIGLFALLLATLQHQRNMKILRKQYKAPYSTAELVAGVILVFGIFSFITVLFRQ